MSANKTAQEQEAISDVVLYADSIEHFDTHDLGDELDSAPEVEFKITPPAGRTYFRLERDLSDKVRRIARQRGVSAVALLNEWVQEKVAEILTVGLTK